MQDDNKVLCAICGNEIPDETRELNIINYGICDDCGSQPLKKIESDSYNIEMDSHSKNEKYCDSI